MTVRALFDQSRARVRGALARRFGVDTRALAALRVSLGVLILVDLLLRSRNIVAFYTDFGVFPRAALREHAPGLARLSVHAVSGDLWVQVVLFLIAGAFGVALVVGYRTTLVTVASFLLLASLHARNPLVLNAGDSLFRRLLLWGIFLPLGGRWSVDALRGGPAEERVASVASAALLGQVVILYTVNAVFKLRGTVWPRGTAIRYVFGLDQFTVLFGDVLAQHPTVLVVLGRLWLGLLVTSVLLVVLTGRARAVFVGLFLAMHGGMVLTLRLGLFPLVSIAALIPFLPPWVWDAATARLSALGRGLHPGRRGGRFAPESTTGTGSGILPGVPSDVLPDVRSEFPPAVPTNVPRGVSRVTRRATPVVVACLLGFVLLWNAASLGFADVPEGVESVADPAEHRWDVFAPSPPRTDVWYVVPGRLESGRRIDAFHRSPVQWDRPPDVARTYPTARWRKYLVDVWRSGDDDRLRNFAAYLCRRWNTRHEDDLVGLTVSVVEQPTRLGAPEPTRRVDLLQYGCPSSPTGNLSLSAVRERSTDADQDQTRLRRPVGR